MKIKTLYRPELVTAELDESLAEAASRMASHDVSALAILFDGELAGILTERDLARALAAGVDPHVTPISRFMSLHPYTTYAEADSSEVAQKMLDLGIRHLFVMSGRNVVGIVSSRDLLALEAWDGSQEAVSSPV